MVSQGQPEPTVACHAAWSPSTGAGVDATLFIGRTPVAVPSIGDVTSALHSLSMWRGARCRTESQRHGTCSSSSLVCLNKGPVGRNEGLRKPLLPISHYRKRVTLCCEYIVLIDQKLIIKEKIQILARFSKKETVLMIFQLHRCYVPDARKSSFHFGILIKGINHWLTHFYVPWIFRCLI